VSAIGCAANRLHHTITRDSLPPEEGAESCSWAVVMCALIGPSTCDERVVPRGATPTCLSGGWGMSRWHQDCYQRCVAYVTQLSGRLLVFDRLDVDAAPAHTSLASSHQSRWASRQNRPPDPARQVRQSQCECHDEDTEP